MVTTIIPEDVPLNPYGLNSLHQDFSRFPDTIAGHDSQFREGLIKSSRTLGEQVMADLLEIALSDLWVIEQCPVHNRFPDFFVPAFNLVIEVDGGYHRKGSSRHRLDWYKDWALSKRGFNVFHIDNQVLVENFWLALSELRAFIERLLEPITSSGNFCPWGWTHYLQHKQTEKEGFSLSNPQDLASIRWEISIRFPKPEQCPSNWCVAVREEAFKTEAKILDLENQEYECEPGSDGNFIFPRLNKATFPSSIDLKGEPTRKIFLLLCREIARIVVKDPDSIKLTDRLVSDLMVYSDEAKEMIKALGSALDLDIRIEELRRIVFVSDLVRYILIRKYR